MAEGMSPCRTCTLLSFHPVNRLVVCERSVDHHTHNVLSFFLTILFLGSSSPPPPARAPPTSPEMNGSASYTNGTPAVPEKDTKSSQQSLANIVRRKLTGYVGFANLPNQWHRKSVRKGFNFNVMVVGTALSPVCWCCTG